MTSVPLLAPSSGAPPASPTRTRPPRPPPAPRRGAGGRGPGGGSRCAYGPVARLESECVKGPSDPAAAPKGPPSAPPTPPRVRFRGPAGGPKTPGPPPHGPPDPALWGEEEEEEEEEPGKLFFSPPLEKPADGGSRSSREPPPTSPPLLLLPSPDSCGAPELDVRRPPPRGGGGGGGGGAAEQEPGASQDFLEARFQLQLLLEPQAALLLLPQNLLLHILSLLPTPSLAALKCCCRHFASLMDAYGVRGPPTPAGGRPAPTATTLQAVQAAVYAAATCRCVAGTTSPTAQALPLRPGPLDVLPQQPQGRDRLQRGSP
ncbi:unnamed protein product [Gadus morhua 'NCC']